ncbi:MAG: hypothetical protein GYA59_17080, partial [Chloroflexi bacterium]|nr:hypothetical protein [Chloroflexota bacterium]
DDVLVLTLVLESIVAIPYLFGAQITKTAIELDLLIRIERLTLRQPIFREGLRKVAGFSEAGHKTSLRRSWLVQENLPVDVAPGVYEWSLAPEKGIYLIATFEKFVLLFVRALSLEDSYTVMINRADILSMEIGQVIRPEAK